MDPARKRTVRLVVALSAAVLLAGALVYTSFTASSEARSPSQLLTSAQPGKTYQLTGKVVPGYSHEGTCTRLPRARPQRQCLGPGPLHGRAARPVPRRARGHRQGPQAGRRVRRREGLAGDEVPVEVQREAVEPVPDVPGRRSRLPVPGARSPRSTASAPRCTARGPGAATGSTRAAARSTRWPASLIGRVRHPRDRVPALGLLVRAGLLALVDHTTPTFYQATAMWSSQEGSLLLWLWLLSLWSSLILFADPPAAARGRSLRDRGAARLRRRSSSRCSCSCESPFETLGPRAGRGRRPQPAAAAPEHDDPPADALLGLHAVHGPVRVRDRRADHAAARRDWIRHTRPSRWPRGSSSASGSCSARAGPTPSSAGAATGPGTRSRTRR